MSHNFNVNDTVDLFINEITVMKMFIFPEVMQ